MKEVSIEELERKILFKRVVEWCKDYIKLEDGTKITLECTEQDCCAYAGGIFEPSSDMPELDAMITNIIIGNEISIPDTDTRVSRVKLLMLHNQNVLCKGVMTADAGNGGYYYSVGSLVVGDAYTPIVEA